MVATARISDARLKRMATALGFTNREKFEEDWAKLTPAAQMELLQALPPTTARTPRAPRTKVRVFPVTTTPGQKTAG